MLKHSLYIVIILILFSFSELKSQVNSSNENGNKLDSIKNNRWTSIGKVNIFVASGEGAIAGGAYQGIEYNQTFALSVGFNIRIIEKGRFALLTGLEFDFLSFSTTVKIWQQGRRGFYYQAGMLQVTLNEYFTGIPVACSFRLNNKKSSFYLGIKAGGIFGINSETSYYKNSTMFYSGATLSLPLLIEGLSW